MRTLTLLAALGIAISGLIGIFHAGVEYGFWEGLTTCSTTQSGPVTLDSIMAAPLIRCDVPRSEEHTSELQSLMSISYAVFCLKKNNTIRYTLLTHKLPHL